MIADKSRSGSSNVPYGTVSVNAVLVSALVGCPVRAGVLSLDVAAGSSVSDLIAICKKIVDTSSRMNIAVSFYLADAHNHTLPYSPERKRFLVGIRMTLGANYARRIAKCAVIGRRWPKDRRSEDVKHWRYFETHRPGVLGQPDIEVKSKDVDLSEVSRESVTGGGTRFALKSPNGSRYFFLMGEVKP